jgi:hypothetical protein
VIIGIDQPPFLLIKAASGFFEAGNIVFVTPFKRNTGNDYTDCRKNDWAQILFHAFLALMKKTHGTPVVQWADFRRLGRILL